MKKAWFLMLLALAVALYGCSPSQTETGDPKGPPSIETQNPAATISHPTQLPGSPIPIQVEPTPMAPPLSTPYQSDLQNLINIATEDLAERFSIPKAEIEVEAAYSVIWPDAGLGCSQSGMASAQVLTPGYLIMLQHNDMNYEYHADKGTYVTYCENPSAPIVLPDQ
jgi:hypothetical protein